MVTAKRLFSAVVLVVGILIVGVLSIAAGEDQKKKSEGIPRIVHLDATATYLVSPDIVVPPQFRVHVRGTIFVPENTHVATKLLLPFRSTWLTTETFGPYAKGQTVNYVKHYDVDAKTWNGKTFTAKLMASSSAGAVTGDATVTPIHRKK